MKKCPVCDVLLEPEDYEGFQVQLCGHCSGRLVSSANLEAIKRVARKTVQELKAEASSWLKESPSRRIRCPRCHALMERRPANVPMLDLHTDTCRACGVVWLDGGELALLQLAYQLTPGFADAQEFKRRMQTLEDSPERKARFEEDLAKLPMAPNPVEEGMKEGLEDWFLGLR